jgi:hypothetical protein
MTDAAWRGEVEPRTEAGRTFLSALTTMDALDPVKQSTPVDWAHGIRAIEDEASALDAAWAEAEALRSEGWELTLYGPQEDGVYRATCAPSVFEGPTFVLESVRRPHTRRCTPSPSRPPQGDPIVSGAEKVKRCIDDEQWLRKVRADLDSDESEWIVRTRPGSGISKLNAIGEYLNTILEELGHSGPLHRCSECGLDHTKNGTTR